MKKSTRLSLIAAGLLGASSLSAAITISTVQVGDAGNAADATGDGAVGYTYYIGTYEVTNSQYAAFLNAKATTDTYSLYNTNMGSNATNGGIIQSGSNGSFSYSVKSGFENKPVNYVSFWDAARFTNWLTTGDTETGVYVLTTNGMTNNTITRDATAWANGGVAIASENEWYKAAYYDQSLNSGSGGYWTFPNQSNSITTADANYGDSVGSVSAVGTYAGDSSYYGTFDQGGNVFEWNEDIVFSDAYSGRRVRGGSFLVEEGDEGNSFELRSSTDYFFNFTNTEIAAIGFRVSSLAPIPEPSTYAAILGGLGLLLALKRRKRR